MENRAEQYREMLGSNIWEKKVHLPFILKIDWHSYSSKNISVIASCIGDKFINGSVIISGDSLKFTGQHSLLKI